MAHPALCMSLGGHRCSPSLAAPNLLGLRPGQMSWRRSSSGNPRTQPPTGSSPGQDTDSNERQRPTQVPISMGSNSDSRHCVLQVRSHPPRCRAEEEGEETEGRGPCSLHISTHPLAAGHCSGEEALRRGGTGCISMLIRAEKQPLSHTSAVWAV